MVGFKEVHKRWFTYFCRSNEKKKTFQGLRPDLSRSKGLIRNTKRPVSVTLSLKPSLFESKSLNMKLLEHGKPNNKIKTTVQNQETCA